MTELERIAFCVILIALTLLVLQVFLTNPFLAFLLVTLLISLAVTINII